MRKTIILIISFLACLSIVSAAGETFLTVLGGTSDDIGHSVAITSDGGYIVTGYSGNYGGSDNDLFLVKFSSTGVEEWSKTVGGANSDTGSSVAVTSDGGYIVTGSSGSYGGSDYDLFLVKFSSTGVEEWSKTVGGGNTDLGSSVAVTSDGGYIVTGQSKSYGSGNYDIFLVKFSSTGAEEWSKTVGGGDNDYGRSVAITSDGGYIVTGESQSYGVINTVLLLVKFSSTGVEEWTKVVWEGSADYGQSVAVTSDGGYIVAGYVYGYSGNDYDLFLIKFSSTGIEEWSKTVGGTGNDKGYSVAVTSDGGYIVTGESRSYGDSDSDLFLVKFSSTGTEEWSKTVGGGDTDIGTSVAVTSDEGYIVVGYSGSYGGSDTDVLLLRVDADGNIENCSEVVGETVTEENHDISEVEETVTEENHVISELDHVITEQSHDADDTQICFVAVMEIPTYSTFTSIETTNFSSVNLTNVPNLTLAINSKGKIRFPSDHNINAKNEDYDANIDIEDAIIYVNSTALDSSFNNSATLTFDNIDCSVPYVYYSDTASTRSAILLENKLCFPPRCTNIQCSAGTLTVDVTHFSGYAVNGSANLTIDANDPKYTEQLVTFTAEYMNATGLITGATCNISFSDGNYIMDEQTTYYNYSRTFASVQIVDYNVTCSATGENIVFANDTAIIQSTEIPEFSILTLGLGLIAILIGLFVIRKKR